MDPTFDAYECCTLCPRECKKNRINGEVGFCKQTAILKISSIGPHFGEEPPISGINGSGTVFFTGCSTGCFFCQNYQISRENMGREFSLEAFVEEVKRLAGFSVHNLNFVTPDHFWPHIRALAIRLKKEGLSIPFLINSSGFQKPETVREMAEYCDIFMPDMKFSDPALAEFCMGRNDYPRIAIKAVELMVEKKGFLDSWFDEETGKCPPTARGVLVRHLILPGAVENSKGVLRMLKESVGRYIHLSLMSQYRPTPYCTDKHGFDRGITRAEFQEVLDFAQELGFENVFYQVPGGGDEFMPDFSKKEPFKGNEKQ